MAVFPDRIVLKNSTDSQASIEAAIATGGTDEISQGEIVLGIENTQVKFYTKSGNGNIVTIGGTGGFGALSLGDLTDTDLSTPPTDGQVLTYVASTGNWEPLGVGGYDDPLTTNGDIVIRSGGVTTRLGIGTEGQVLRVSSGEPVWAGGNLDNIVEDTTPQLGGDFDINGFAIVSTGNTNINLAPAGVGGVVIQGNTEDGKITLQSSSNAHGVTIFSPPDAAGATYDLVLPTSAGASGQVLSTDGAGVLSWVAQPGGSGSSVFDLNDVEKVENTGTTIFLYNAGGCDTPTGDGSTWANGTAHTDTSAQDLYVSDLDANGADLRAAVTLKVANFGTPVPFWTSPTGTGSWTSHSSLDDPTANTNRLDFNSGGFTECSRPLYVTLEDPAGGTPVLEPTANQALLWDATELAFLPGNVTTDLSTSSIDALSDVDTTTVAPTDGQALVWDNAASEWKPGTVASGTVDTSIQWTVTANGTSDYIFSGDGFAGTETDPQLYVVRGQTYKIINNMGAHPFQIQSTQGLGGTAYQDGITNNAVSNGTLTWEVRMDAPTTLYYQCTLHSLMNGTITVLDNAGSGNVVGAIDDLSDVDTSTTAPVDGQALLWDNTTSEWKPGNVVASGVPSVIDDLNDVDTSTVAPELGQVLSWVGSQWEPATPNAAGLPIASDGEALIYQNGEWVAGPVIGGVDYNSADPHFNSTGLIINPEGANGSTSFTDESSNAAAISGNGEISTTQAKFGSASAYFDGNDQYLFVSNASWMSFGANAFTVEAWIWIDANSALDGDSNRTAAIINTFPQAGAPTADESWDFFVTGDGTTTGTGLQFRYQDNSAFGIDVSGSATISQSAWHHVAAVRYNNTLSLYLDGTSIGSGSVTGQSISSVNGLNVGAFRFGSDISDLNGYIDGVRVTTGVARYTGNFTAPTVAFPVGSTQVTIPYSIDKLDDVDTTTAAPTQGQALVWNNTAQSWEPGTIAGGATTIDGLGDVDTSTVAPTEGQVLKWNNTDSEWQPADTSIQTASDFQYKDTVFRFDTLSNSTGNFGAGYNAPGEAAAQSGTTIFYYEDADGNDLNNEWNPFLNTSVTLLVSTDGVNFTQLTRSLSLTTQYVAEGAYMFTGGNLFDPSTDSEVYISIVSSGGAAIEDKDLLVWNSTDQAFEPGKLSVDDLTDVDTSTVAPADGQALLWDNTNQKWEPGTVSGGGGTSLPSGSSDGEALIWENGAWSVGPVIGGVDYVLGDLDFSNVSVLLLGNGSNGSTTFTDSSSSPFTFTGNGAAEISTTQSKFGGASIFLPSSTASYLSTTSDSSLSLDGDFTIEAWIYNTGGGTYRPIIGSGKTGWGGGAFAVDIYAGGANPVLTLQQHSGAATLTGTTALSLNTWHHVAVTRSGSTVRLFVDGVQDGSTSTTGTYDFGNNNTFYVGNHGWDSNEYHGYIDDLRITKGVARYTANFTPPTAELPTASGTTISIPYSIDKLEDVDTSTVAPTDGQALLWDAANNKWEPGTVSGGGGATAIDDLSDVDTSTAAPTNGQVLTWDGSQWEPATPTASGLPAAQDGEALIYQNGQWVAGPVIGGVDYTSSSDSSFNNVELLLFGNGTNGSTTFTDSSSNALTLTVAGNTQISTTQSKYGGASIYFDGVGDRLTVTDSVLALGTGEFTIEFWMYAESTAQYEAMMACGNADTNNSWQITGGSTLSLSLGTSGVVASTTFPSLDTWHHVAATRDSSNTVRLFLNGTSVGSATNTTDLTASNLNIGANRAVNAYFHGYLDDIRITKGVARYTTNFTAPTAELPTGGTTVTIPYSIDNLDDVDTSTVAPTDGQALVWDNTASQWEPGTITSGTAIENNVTETFSYQAISVNSGTTYPSAAGQLSVDTSTNTPNQKIWRFYQYDESGRDLLLTSEYSNPSTITITRNGVDEVYTVTSGPSLQGSSYQFNTDGGSVSLNDTFEFTFARPTEGDYVALKADLTSYETVDGDVLRDIKPNERLLAATSTVGHVFDTFVSGSPAGIPTADGEYALKSSSTPYIRIKSTDANGDAFDLRYVSYTGSTGSTYRPYFYALANNVLYEIPISGSISHAIIEDYYQWNCVGGGSQLAALQSAGSFRLLYPWEAYDAPQGADVLAYDSTTSTYRPTAFDSVTGGTFGSG